ncbi:DNA polymerase epsilon catalytic subunit A-like protein [Tanacetum coccineum]
MMFSEDPCNPTCLRNYSQLRQIKGKDIEEPELLDYISESSTMSKPLAEYGEQKLHAVTTSRRLAHFLGDAMVKDKGLCCLYVIACEPGVCLQVAVGD